MSEEAKRLLKIEQENEVEWNGIIFDIKRKGRKYDEKYTENETRKIRFEKHIKKEKVRRLSHYYVDEEARKRWNDKIIMEEKTTLAFLKI